jgi:hypothetical protein
LNWIGHVNRTDSKRKVCQVFNREVHYEEDQKADGGILYKQILLNAQLQIGKSSKNRADWEKSNKEAKVVVPSKRIKKILKVENMVKNWYKQPRLEGPE